MSITGKHVSSDGWERFALHDRKPIRDLFGRTKYWRGKPFLCVYVKISFIVTNFSGKTKQLVSRRYSYAKRLNKRPDNWSFVRQFAYENDRGTDRIGCGGFIYFSIFSISINNFWATKLNINSLFAELRANIGERFTNAEPFKLNPK